MGSSPASPPRTAGQWFRWTVLALVCISLGTLLVMAQQVSRELQNLSEEPLDDINWNLTQLEVDLLLFGGAIQTSLARETPDLQKVRFQYDLFYNRVQITTKSRYFRGALPPEDADRMSALLLEFIGEVTPVIDSADPVLIARLPDLLAQSESVRRNIRTITAKLIHENAGQTRASRESLTLLMQKLGWTTAFVLLSLITLLYATLILRQQSETSKTETEQLTSRLQATVGAAIDAVIIVDAEGRILDFNGAAEGIFGYTRAEAIGRTLEQLLIPEGMVDLYRKGIERFSHHGLRMVIGNRSFTLMARRKSGEQFPVELSATSDVSPNGTIIIAYLRDLSERQATEMRLRQARDKALAAERAKTNFIAVVSHEMRTPLNGLLATLDFAQEEAVSPVQSRFLGLAQSSAEQLLRHVNDVLDISKAETGHFAIVQEGFNLSDLITRVVEPAKARADRDGTSLTVAMPPACPSLTGDPFRIGQILNNLVTNALKFAPGGAVSVDVRISGLPDRWHLLRVEVADTGIGISEADQERIFDPFVMLDASYGRSAGGTGLGLAISRGLAERMGGSLTVQSALGEGSRFVLELPLVECEQELLSPDALLPDPECVADIQNILIVEDNPTNQIVLTELVRRMGHEVDVADDGLMGVKMARAKRYDLILMDVSMPKMDGPTATQEIRREGASMGTRVIAVTAHSMPEEIARFRAAGMHQILTKPINRNALMKIVGCARQARAAAEGRTPEEMEAMMPGAVPAPVASDGEAPVSPAPAPATNVPRQPSFDLERLGELVEALGLERTGVALERFSADMGRLLRRFEDVMALTGPERAALFHEAKGCAAVIGHKELHLLGARGETAAKAGHPDAAILSIVADFRHQVDGLAADIREALDEVAAMPAA